MRRPKADLVYGATGTYKTSNIGRVAHALHKAAGKVTHLVSADGGGWEPLQPLVDAGIMRVWPVRLWPNCIEAVDKACQGYWPIDCDDPLKPLQPPTEALLKNVGMVALEGLTSFGSLIMGKLKQPGVTLSQAPSYELLDGSTKYAGGSMAAFGFVQDRIYEFVMKSHMIPFVDKVLWTALEAKGEEEGTKIPIFGPAIEGKKATGKAGQWFCNLFHMEAVAVAAKVDEKTKQLSLTTEVFLYLRSHADPNSKVVFPAKVRAPFSQAALVPERMAPDLSEAYKLLDDLKKKADEELAGGKK